jgi:hypothetical protein
MGRPALGIPLAVPRSKVSPKRFQCDTLDIDFARGSKAQAAKNRYWGTPSLDSVLKEKGTNDQGNRKPPSVDRGSKCCACKSESRSICFQQTLNVPFLVELP